MGVRSGAGTSSTYLRLSLKRDGRADGRVNETFSFERQASSSDVVLTKATL